MLKRFRKLPIGKKLQAINLLIVGLITLLTTISLCFYMYATVRDDYRNDSEILSSLLAESVNSALMFGDKKTAQEALAGLRAVGYVTHAELYDKAGNLFAGYEKATGKFGAPANFDIRGYQQEIRFGSLAFDSAFPVLSIAPGREQIGTITMHMDLTAAYVHLGYQIFVLLLIGLLCAAVVSTVLSKLQKSITQSIPI